MPKRIEARQVTIRWRPQPRQLTFLQAAGVSHPFDGSEPRAPLARVIGYGGAAGGGKSDSLLLTGIIAGLTWPGCNAGYFRREYPQLEGPGGAIMRSRQLMSGWARWNGNLRRWTLPTGSVLEFCHCKDENDVYNYQSQQFDVLLFDEATQFTRFQVRYLLTRNRLTVRMPAPICAMATNPGNIGHHWFREEFVDSGPPEQPHDVEIEPGRIETRVFIPAKLSDNSILERRDPGYRRTLENQDEVTRRMLLDGDWDVIAGAVFSEWRREKHVITPEQLPASWRTWNKFMSLDWGRNKPGCALWWAISPDGRLYIYREFYFNGGHTPDMDAYDAAKAIRHLEEDGEDIAYRAADPAMWIKESRKGLHGESMADDFAAAGCPLIRADNDRLNGLNRVHAFLKDAPDGLPWVQVVDTCRHLIRTLPALPRDQVKVEDVDTDAEDHAYDAFRYGAMSRPAPAKFDAVDTASRRRADLAGKEPDEIEDERNDPESSYASWGRGGYAKFQVGDDD